MNTTPRCLPPRAPSERHLAMSSSRSNWVKLSPSVVESAIRDVEADSHLLAARSARRRIAESARSTASKATAKHLVAVDPTAVPLDAQTMIVGASVHELISQFRANAISHESLSVCAEAAFHETLLVTKHLPSPNPLRTAMACHLLDRLTATNEGRQALLYERLKAEIFCSVYQMQDSKQWVDRRLELAASSPVKPGSGSKDADSLKELLNNNTYFQALHDERAKNDRLMMVMEAKDIQQAKTQVGMTKIIARWQLMVVDRLFCAWRNYARKRNEKLDTAIAPVLALRKKLMVRRMFLEWRRVASEEAVERLIADVRREATAAQRHLETTVRQSEVSSVELRKATSQLLQAREEIDRLRDELDRANQSLALHRSRINELKGQAVRWRCRALELASCFCTTARNTIPSFDAKPSFLIDGPSSAHVLTFTSHVDDTVQQSLHKQLLSLPPTLQAEAKQFSTLRALRCLAAEPLLLVWLNMALSKSTLWSRLGLVSPRHGNDTGAPSSLDPLMISSSFVAFGEPPGPPSETATAAPHPGVPSCPRDPGLPTPLRSFIDDRMCDGSVLICLAHLAGVFASRWGVDNAYVVLNSAVESPQPQKRQRRRSSIARSEQREGIVSALRAASSSVDEASSPGITGISNDTLARLVAASEPSRRVQLGLAAVAHFLNCEDIPFGLTAADVCAGLRPRALSAFVCLAMAKLFDMRDATIAGDGVSPPTLREFDPPVGKWSTDLQASKESDAMNIAAHLQHFASWIVAEDTTNRDQLISPSALSREASPGLSMSSGGSMEMPHLVHEAQGEVELRQEAVEVQLIQGLVSQRADSSRQWQRLADRLTGDLVWSEAASLGSVVAIKKEPDSSSGVGEGANSGAASALPPRETNLLIALITRVIAPLGNAKLAPLAQDVEGNESGDIAVTAGTDYVNDFAHVLADELSLTLYDRAARLRTVFTSFAPPSPGSSTGSEGASLMTHAQFVRFMESHKLFDGKVIPRKVASSLFDFTIEYVANGGVLKPKAAAPSSTRARRASVYSQQAQSHSLVSVSEVALSSASASLLVPPGAVSTTAQPPSNSGNSVPSGLTLMQWTALLITFAVAHAANPLAGMTPAFLASARLPPIRQQLSSGSNQKLLSMLQGLAPASGTSSLSEVHAVVYTPGVQTVLAEFNDRLLKIFQKAAGQDDDPEMSLQEFSQLMKESHVEEAVTPAACRKIFEYFTSSHSMEGSSASNAAAGHGAALVYREYLEVLVVVALQCDPLLIVPPGDRLRAFLRGGVPESPHRVMHDGFCAVLNRYSKPSRK